MIKIKIHNFEIRTLISPYPDLKLKTDPDPTCKLITDLDPTKASDQSGSRSTILSVNDWYLVHLLHVNILLPHRAVIPFEPAAKTCSDRAEIFRAASSY